MLVIAMLLCRKNSMLKKYWLNPESTVINALAKNTAIQRLIILPLYILSCTITQTHKYLSHFFNRAETLIFIYCPLFIRESALKMKSKRSIILGHGLRNLKSGFMILRTIKLIIMAAIKISASEIDIDIKNNRPYNAYSPTKTNKLYNLSLN